MLSQKTLEQYFEALSTHNGPLAASLFHPDGAIDDFRGKHHAGRGVIEKFINQVPELRLEFLSDFIVEGSRATAYGNIHYPGQAPLLIRWIFTAAGDQIAHLCNSRIEQIPEARRK